jgi:tRNA A-37 threonylcarbamoyl transferase component Bud32
MRQSVFPSGVEVLHYRLEERIGSGAVGVVYRAFDTRLKRPVVLKFLRDEYLEDEEARERFNREALALSALSHPGIVAFYGLEQTEDQTFIVMEPVEGETLKEKLSSGSRGLSADEIIDVMDPLLDALGFAHSAGIVHRDVKPANILITRDGRLKLSDFGLASITDRSRFTRTGQLVGSPNYMSPEQVQGRAVDPRSDIFSVGGILYELIHGVVPFHGESYVSILHEVVYSEPRFTGEYDDPGIAALARVAAKALKKDPEERYADAEVMRREIGRVRCWAEDAPQEWVAGVGVDPASSPPDTASVRGTPRSRLGMILMVGLPALLLFAVLSIRFFAGPGSRNPVDYEVVGNRLTLLDEGGKPIWSVEYPYSIEYFKTLSFGERKQLLRVVDLDGDGRNEVLFGMHQAAEDGRRTHLICYGPDGAERWRVKAGRELSFGSGAGETRGLFWVRFVDVHDFDHDGRMEIVLVSTQKLFYPCQILLLDPDGERLGEFWNSGYVYCSAYADVDGDGVDELLLGGTNNEYRRSCLAVLDVSLMSGASPQLLDRYRAPELGPGTEMQYILLEKSDFAELSLRDSRIGKIDVLNDVIALNAYEAITTGNSDECVYAYLMSRDLRPASVVLGNDFLSAQYAAYRAGFIDRNVSEDPEYLEQLRSRMMKAQYWTGSAWSDEPAVNALWEQAREEGRSSAQAGDPLPADGS